MSFKPRFQRLLCRTPHLFKFILLRRQNPDRNKLAFLSLIQRGQTVFDVGANFGSYTTLFSDIVTDSGKVYAFEPVQASSVRLRHNIRGKANVVAVQKGLGASECSATIFIPDSDLGQSSLARHKAGSWSNPVAVREEDIKITTLDSFVREFAIGRIDFIKVDIEGAEPLFLAGGEQTIRRFHPVLFLELNVSWLQDFGESPATVAAMLARWGYSFVYEPVLEGRDFRLNATKVCAQSNGDFLFATSSL